MFKIESYITPIILSYVDKYIKNFRPQDSQVSLWGGDATFHNLDLRLEVLEQELNLPFTFVSGHIHELTIHVPWTKLNSESINITINTIECTLKLRGEDSYGSDGASHTSGGSHNSPTSPGLKESRRKARKELIAQVAPPGYVQSLINKIVNNITIVCNNLILKYVEEDIVLSVNAKSVTFQSANEKWEPAFTEPIVQLMSRKIVNLVDLTICLDKRNASGKIELYQEPLLYRCSTEVHLLKCYLSKKAKQANTTRIDLKCSRMDFSLSEQQIPMLMRLINLVLALQAKELKAEPSSTNIHSEDEENAPEKSVAGVEEESWAGWAWSWIPPILPSDWDEDWNSEQQVAYAVHTFHFGVYVAEASISFKVTEQTLERSYYGPKKVKFVPYLILQLKGSSLDMVAHDISWFNLQVGISRVTLEPHADCFCGVWELSPNHEKTEQVEAYYFSVGKVQDTYLEESLFDPEASENKGLRKQYNVSWDNHTGNITELSLLERTPALVVDFLFKIDFPEDFDTESLSEFDSNFEYANLAERTLCRIALGPTLLVKLTPGLFHRVQMLTHATEAYDYSPYSIPKPEPTLEELPPASSDDFDALNENIPLVEFCVTLFKPTVHIYFNNHRPYEPASYQGQHRKRRDARKMLSVPNDPAPVFSVDCKRLEAIITRPMYPNRLVRTACKLPDPPPRMFHACHKFTQVNLVDIGAQLLLFSTAKPTTILAPTTFTHRESALLMPQYWRDRDVYFTERQLDSSDSLTVTLTHAKMLVATYVFASLVEHGAGSDVLRNTSLLTDAAKDTGVEYLEVYMEALSYRQVDTPRTVCRQARLGAARAFVLDTPTGGEPRQALVLSGGGEEVSKQAPLLAATLQLPLEPDKQAHPPVVLINVGELRACVDPLLWRWLCYRPALLPFMPDPVPRIMTPRTRTSASTTDKRPAPAESVHSSSDQQATKTKSDKREAVTVVTNASGGMMRQNSSGGTKASDEKPYDRELLLRWFPVWRGLVLSGDISRCVVYLPTASLSAVGLHSIEEALQRADQAVLVVEFPRIALRSAAHRQPIEKFLAQLPIVLPEEMWGEDKVSFPWTVSLTDASCLTIQGRRRLHFLKPTSVNATVTMTAKFHSADKADGQPTADLASLSLNVYSDTTPVKIAVSEPQMVVMSSVLASLMEVAAAFTFEAQRPRTKSADVIPRPQSPTSPTTYQESSLSRDTVSNPRPRTISAADLQQHEDKQSTTTSKLPNAPPSIISLQSDGVNLIAFIQWTLARVSVTLYTDDPRSPGTELKLQFDTEDIMTSLELTNVFMKLKCKVASAGVQHYRRVTSQQQRWGPGNYLGLVMRGNEELSTSAEESDGFASVLFTRALRKNVHTKWGAATAAARKVRKTSQSQQESGQNNQESHYLSEIVVKLQSVDVVLSPITLSSFTCILRPLLAVPGHRKPPSPTAEHRPAMLDINNHTLPLLYLETRAMRLTLPAEEMRQVDGVHDAWLVQIEAFSLRPHAENPLSRIVLRNDLYAMAERSRTLLVPGADVEDRQYQLNISGFSINTANWDDLDRCLLAPPLDAAGTENPAVAWNSLEQDGAGSLTPQLPLAPVVGRVELCVVAAPAVVDRNDVLVCGHSLEVNVLADIEVTLGTGQMLLASMLAAEIQTMLKPLQGESAGSKHASWSAPHATQVEHMVSFTDYQRSSKDSGVSITSPCHLMSPEVEKSSGYHESSEASSRETRDAHLNTVPTEVLITAGAIRFILHEPMDRQDAVMTKIIGRLKERNEESTKRKLIVSWKPAKTWTIRPLLRVVLDQPHLFVSRLPNETKAQASIFGFVINSATSDKRLNTSDVPQAGDFKVALLETKYGDPRRDTGILPSFLTARWTQTGTKPAKVAIEMGRPTMLYASLSQWYFLENALYNVKTCLLWSPMPVTTSTSKMYAQTVSQQSVGVQAGRACGSRCRMDRGGTIHEEENESVADSDGYPSSRTASATREERMKAWLFPGVSSISVSAQQIAVEVMTENNTQMIAGVNAMSGSLSAVSGRDRMAGTLTVDCATLGFFSAAPDAFTPGKRLLVVNPWSCSAHAALTWESWQKRHDPPLFQVTAESDCFVLDIGPERLHCLYTVMSEFQPVIDRFTTYKPPNKAPVEVHEVPSTGVEQEQHYRDDLRAGAFQFLDASGSREELPLPYQVVFWQNPPTMAWRYPQPRTLTRADVFPVPFKVADQTCNSSAQHQVFCWLQYWSEVRGRFMPYAQFTLSESEVRRLELPGQTVACTWRVQLALTGEDDDQASCASLKINPKTLAACMRVDSFFSPRLVPRVQAALNLTSLHLSAFNYIAGGRSLPAPLQDYKPDKLLPQSHCVLTCQLDNASLYFSAYEGDKSLVDLSSYFRVDVVDYANLTQRCVVEPFRGRLTVNLDENVDVSCVTKPVTVRFSAATAHTLAVTAQLWSQALREFHGVETKIENQVVFTRYVVCNNTCRAFKFGQYDTNEDIKINLEPRECHFYAWRSQKVNQLLRLQFDSLVRTRPFSIDTDGTTTLQMQDACGFSVVLKVKSLSVTQKQVTISGLLTIANIIAEDLECRLLECGDDTKSQLVVVPGNSTPPTLLVDGSQKMRLRLRYKGLESGMWSGDIPMRINARTGTPWLVKVPMQDRGYVCVWCHVFSGPCGSILAALYPLFSIRSLLPVTTHLSVETPGLKTNITSEVLGRGNEQQLYCPGTVDHTHKLTFRLGSDPPMPHVPLAYSMLERSRGMRFEGEASDIDEVVNMLRKSSMKKDWPFAGDDYAGVDWVVPPQPDNDIKVRYESRGPHCATLQVQLHPWALFLNTLGVAVDLVIEDHLACRIPHRGVLVPPRLEGTFNLGIDSVEMHPKLYKSPLLLLQKSGESFYNMPKITGIIPVMGHMQVAILCGYTVALACLDSSTVADHGDLKVVHIKPSYIISNRSGKGLLFACLALHDTNVKRPVPNAKSSKIIPSTDTNGHPLVHWMILDMGDTELVPYLMVSCGANWSRPIKVDDKLIRKGFSMPLHDGTDMPLVLVTQERGGQTYLSVHRETHPHVIVNNLCQFKLLVAECKPDEVGPISETPHLDWHCSVEPRSSAHYSLPSMQERFPAILPLPKTTSLLFALADAPSEDQRPHWSAGVSIAETQEQFVRLPCHGDVIVRVETVCMTTRVTVDTVSHVEISARDVRSRLSQQNFKSVTLIPSVGSQLESQSSSNLGSISLANVSMVPSSEITIIGQEDSAMSFQSRISEVSFLSAEGSTAGTWFPTDRSVEKIVTHINSTVKFPKVERTAPAKMVTLNCFLRGFNLTLTESLIPSEHTEVMTLTLDNICLSVHSQIVVDKVNDLEITVALGDIQLDNQIYQRGGFDFPVVLISQTPNRNLDEGFSLGIPAQKLIDQTLPEAILNLSVLVERSNSAAKIVKLYVGPIGAYLEDIYLIKLSESFVSLLPPNLTLPSDETVRTDSDHVRLPLAIYVTASEIANPLRLRSLSIDPVNILLSVHSSVKIYLALDRSPLYFQAFQRRSLETTPYRLGHALTMHYVSGALFGAGWVVGSLELLGSPGGLARTLGTGLRDFVRLPCQGILLGPWGFLAGATHGSASLLRHVAAGAVGSVTGLASSVARNLDRLTLDSEHLQRTEELRRIRPQGIRQGFAQGLTGLGISLLGAVGGIAHHPIQAAMADSASTRNVVAGVGLGLVGAITKPLSGAAELVASTGRGLLSATGWAMQPEPRSRPIIEHAFSASNSRLKYSWKLSLSNCLLHVAEASCITPAGNYEAVSLVLTTNALYLIDSDSDETNRVLPLSDLEGLENPADPTLLCFTLKRTLELESELDAASRARVEDFVRQCSGMILDGTQSHSSHSSSPVSGNPMEAPLKFYVNPQARNYFLSLLELAKKQMAWQRFRVI